MPLFSVIILNWNGGRYLQEAIWSVLRQTVDDLELILVDNASSDGSAQQALQTFRHDPRLTAIQNTTNLGYCRGNNVALRRCRGDFVLTMNPDVMLEDSFLAEIHSAFGSPEVGMAAGLLLRHANPATVDSAGTRCFSHLFATARWAGQPLSNLDQPCEVFGTIGACAVYRRAMLEDLRHQSTAKDEYFDEDFFTYFDEHDLQLRARWRGWRCRYVPSAKAVHVWRHSVKEGWISHATLYHYAFRNYYLSMVKNLTLIQFLLGLPGLFLQECGLGALSFLYRSPICFSAKWSALPLIPTMLAKRKQIMRSRTISVRRFNAGLHGPRHYLHFLIQAISSEWGTGKLLSFSDHPSQVRQGIAP